MQSQNQEIKNEARPPHYVWIEYQKKHQICYVRDFLKEHQNEPKSFYQALDLPVPQQESITRKFGGLDEVADRLYKKILRHGQLEPMNSIAKKTGAIGKLKKTSSEEQNFDRDNNYYDQNDPFIDDEEIQVDKHRNQMDFVIAEYSDFASFEGSLSQFVKSDIYRNRLEILDSVGRDTSQELKRKLVQPTNQKEPTDKKPKDKEKEKDAPVDKVKKKVKKNPATKEKEQNTEHPETTTKEHPKPMVPTPITTILPNIPQPERFGPPHEFATHRMTPGQAQTMLQQFSQFQLHNPLSFPMSMNGPNRINPMMFYPIGSPIGMPPIGYPLNSQPIQKKESEIIEIDHE